MKQKVRQIVAEIGKVDVAGLADAHNLFDAGLTSFTSVQVMFALEAAFNIEFPDDMLNRGSFSSIANMCDRVGILLGRAEAA